MKENSIFINNEDEEKYTFTPWGCLCAVLTDYGFDVDRVSGKVGEHIVEDFMDLMEVCGYVSKEREENNK